MTLRLTRSGRKHRIGKKHIEFVIDNNEPMIDGDQHYYVGHDDRGVELEIATVPDDKHPGERAIIHAMPTRYRSKP